MACEWARAPFTQSRMRERINEIMHLLCSEIYYTILHGVCAEPHALLTASHVPLLALTRSSFKYYMLASVLRTYIHCANAPTMTVRINEYMCEPRAHRRRACELRVFVCVCVNASFGFLRALRALLGGFTFCVHYMFTVRPSINV